VRDEGVARFHVHDRSIGAPAFEVPHPVGLQGPDFGTMGIAPI